MAEFKRAQVCATTIAVTSLAAVIVILRFIARYMTVKSKWTKDDWLTVAAIVRCPTRLSGFRILLIRLDSDFLQHGDESHQYRLQILQSLKLTLSSDRYRSRKKYVRSQCGTSNPPDAGQFTGCRRVPEVR